MIGNAKNKLLQDRPQNSNFIYIGSAPPGAPEDSPVWRITKVVFADDSMNWKQILRARGEGHIELKYCKWTERENYTYE